MKLLSILKKMWLVPFLALAMVACETEAETNDAELVEFETWVDERAANVEQETEDSWADVRVEYERRTADLDAEAEEWDEETKTRYQTARTRFEDTERNAQQRWEEQAIIIAQPDPQMATALIGTSDYSTITALNIKEKYQMLLQNVRQMDDQWTDLEWEKADMVMDGLDQRREELDVPAEDVARIIAWKGEFNVLKAEEDITGN